MKLRFSSDYRTLLWAFVLFPAVMAAPYASPRLLAWILPTWSVVSLGAHSFRH